jgi:uncharacterized membrane protein required for colicin V production
VDVYVLLDVLLIILIALFIPIGFWRGAYREAFVTLGILFGASLGRFWGEEWGMELAAVTRLHESGGAFMIAMLCLISATFLLGYSAGAAVPVPDPGWVARTLGALIAGANGALLLSFALRDIRVYLLSSEEAGFLDNAVIAPFLSDGTGWILLGAAAVFVPISLVLALFGPEVEDDYYEEEYEMYEEDYADPYAQQTMQIDRGAPQFDPQQQATPRPSPAAAEETRPIPSARAQYGPPVPWDNGGTQQLSPQHTPEPAPVQTQRRSSEVEETQPHRPQSFQQPSEEPPTTSADAASFGASSVEETTEEQRIVFGHPPPSQTEGEEAAKTQPKSQNLCPNCQADIRQTEGFCPRCGEPI